MCCHCMNRREFLGASTALVAGAALLAPGIARAAGASAWAQDLWDPDRPFSLATRPLRVQPVLLYRLPQRREMASFKSWGGVQTEAAVAEECNRVMAELADVAERAEFPVEVLPILRATSEEEAARARAVEADTVIAYPATGSGAMLNAAIPDHGGMVFVRHRSGPVYYWYEALSVRYLRKDGEPADSGKRLSVHDVIVDDTDELLWRLRALHGVKNFLGARIVALGGAAGKYAGEAPDVARDRFKLDIVEVSYDAFGPRIEAALADPACIQRAEQWADRYLAIPNTTLETERPFVVNAFVLYGLFRDLMREHDAQLFTIKECMSTILPLSKTTACLTLGLLNDEGFAAFCESDFVIIPAGILLRYISGRPVFLHNSTFPHKALITCAHCTGPRRMDGARYDPVRLLTHYESEYGAAPKVEMPVGQEVSFIDPEYAACRWLGIKGTVESNPFYEICRSQQDVRLQGNWKQLLNEARDSHWVMVYGDYLREVGYAAPRIGVTWEDLSETA
ncbi:MAG: twin-arginine translocation signal domain-containing protein [Candidatus Hydrogenedentes bacterium]|nr:twin-arginine translocation signal domain-containing protein [Candidatus Hydrogenedentota bacterium]